MKFIYLILILPLGLLLTHHTQAQIQGSTYVQAGSTHDYFYESLPATSYYWAVTNGSVVSSTASSATVTWGSAGSGKIEYKDRGTVVSTLNVTIVSCQTLSPGGIAGPPWVCYGQPSETIFSTSSASGGDGNYSYQWQISSDNSTWSNISGATSTTYDPGVLTSTKYFRRRVTSCSQTQYTTSVQITVLPDWTPGSIGSAQTICYGANAGTLTSVSDAQGADGQFAYQWQYLSGTNWINISGATGKTYSPGSLTTSTTYRRNANAVTCGDIWRASNTVTVTVRASLSPGTVTGAQTICYNTSPGVLDSQASASGGDGSYSYQWEHSANGGSTWTSITGATGTTYHPGNLTSTMVYRRKAASCGQVAYSNSVEVFVRADLSAGSISGNQTICYNSDVSAFGNSASASGGQGNYSYQWEQSTNSGSTWSSVSGATGTTYDAGALTTTTVFRRKVVDGCGIKYSNTITVTINSVAGGAVGANQTICSGGDPAAFTQNTASTGAGALSYQWQSSLNNSTFSAISGATATSFDPPSGLTQTTYYRRVTTSILNSVACTALSNTLVITVNAVTGGSIASNQTICKAGDPVALNQSTAASGSGTLSYQWQSSTNNSTFTNISTATGTTYDPPSGLTQTTYYRRVTTSTLNSIACAATSNTLTVTVNAVTGGSISSNQTICSGSDPVALAQVTGSTASGAISYQWQSSINNSTFSNISGATVTTYDPPSGLAQTTYYKRLTVSTLNSVTCTAPSNTLTISVDALSNGGTLSPEVEAYGVASGQLTLSEHTGAVQKWQSKTGTATWADITHTSTSLSYSNITATTTYRVLVKNGVCAEVNSPEADIIIYAVPSISIQGESSISPGGSTQLFTDPGLYSYEWFRDNVAIPGELSNALVVTKPGTYKLSVRASSSAPVHTTGNVIIGDAIGNQVTPVNYVLNTTFLKKGVSPETDLYALQPRDLNQVVQYFDGLGRPMQTVNIGNSPEGNDVVQPIAYDIFGREEFKYLPYARDIHDGRYVPTALVDQGDFYNTEADIANDGYPFQKTVFESSPLNRVLKQGAAGASWQPDGNLFSTTTDHTVKFSYESNLADSILLWAYSAPTSTYPLGFVNAGTGGIAKYYAANQLFKTRTKDEDQHGVIEYKDKLDRIILKSVEGPDSSWANTYYIYDDFSNLVAVIPPEGTARLELEYFNKTDTDKNNFLSRWAFRYVYDVRNRMIVKQVPGAEPVYMIYDDRDRLVLTQDGNQRGASPSREWTFTKYDALNRPVLTGIFKDSQNRNQEAMQQDVKTFYASAGAEAWYEVEGTAVHGYSNRSFPNVSLESDYLTATYYDNYNFRDNYAGSNYNYVTNHLGGQPATNFAAVKGQTTGAKIKVLGTSGYLWSVTYYDDRYWPIQVKKQNHKGGIDVTTTVYDFTGKILESKTTHTALDLPVLSSRDRNEYDHAGRLVKVYNTISQPANSVTWIDKVGVTESGGDLTKTSASGAYDAGARSENYLPESEDGWFEVTVQSDYRVLIGLADNDVDANYTSIDYAIYLSAGWGLYVYENGSNKGAFGSYSVGDVVRVERTGGAVTYKRNGTVFYTSAIPSSTRLFGDVSIFYNAGKITGGRMSVGAEYLVVTNKYNELGQLIDKALTAKDDGYLQSVDYRYNIRGWLTSINNAQLAQESFTNDDTNDLFGMELFYNAQNVGLGNSALYNGNISAIKWKTPVEQAAALEERKAYVFEYDPMNRLKAASYKAYQVTASNWSGEANNFNEVLSYDLNGNIETLQRNDAKAGASAFSIVSETIDDLRYTYQNGNQLSQVEDPTLNEEGFKNGASASNEYVYDDNGNMIKDLNKAIDSISYNHLNLPSLVTFADGNTIQYTYDATGLKLKQTVSENSTTKVTDYVGPFVYERDTLRFFSMPEGRIVNNNGKYEYQFMLKDHLGNVRVLFGNPFEGDNLLPNADCKNLEYYLNAQNVTRSLETINGESYIKYVSNQSTSTPGMITSGYINVLPGEKYTFKVKGFRDSNPDSPAYLYVWTNNGDLVWPGTNLPYGVEAERWVSNDFTIPEGVTTIRLGVLWRQDYGLAIGDTFYLNEVALFKHQDDDYPAGFELAEQSAEGTRFLNYHPDKINNTGVYSRTGNSAYLLSASTQVSNQVIGPAKSIRVYPGDAVHMEVYGRYLSATNDGTDVGAVIAGALQSAFNLSAGGATDLAFQSISNLFGDGAVIGTLAYPYEDQVPPKAFLNYILFDDNYVPYDFGYDQIGVDAAIPGSSSDKMSLVAKVTRPGYIYIYLSNENEVQQEVYFDDLAIKHVRGVAIQQSDYYPFGLTFNSYQRENSVEQRWKFQGQEHIDDLGLNWDSFKWRNHQPDIGRFFNIDPLADDYVHNSPYAFSENKVTTHIELEGLEGVYIHSEGEIQAGINGQMGEGLVESVTDAAVGLWNAITNPVETATGLWNAITNPVETAIAIKDQTVSSFNENPQKALGKAIGNMIIATATAGVATEAKATSDVAKVTKTVATVEKTVDKATDVAKTTTKMSKVEKSTTTTKIGDKFTKTTEVRPSTKAPGQSRAEYVRYKNQDGKVIRTYKDSYDRANRFQHRKPLTGGPEGRTQ